MGGYADAILLWIMALIVVVLLIEGAFIAVTFIWWRYLAIRIIFGILAIAGLAFIVGTVLGYL